MRVHQDPVSEELVLTSTSKPLMRSKFHVPVKRYSQAEASLKALMRKNEIISKGSNIREVSWQDDNCIAVAGKQGIGKTSFAVLLSAALARQGKKVLFVDTLVNDGKENKYATYKRNFEKSEEVLPGLRLGHTAHGWDVLIAPDNDEKNSQLLSTPDAVHELIENYKLTYDALVFDTTDQFLGGHESSPFIRHFSNVILLTHPYSCDETLKGFVKNLPRAFALNSLTSSLLWDEETYGDELHTFGVWPHMQAFYTQDKRTLQEYGEPLARMSASIIPNLPLAFRE